MLLIGKTGQGKSMVMINILASDMQAGNGCCLIDPHGDLADAALDLVPSNRIHETMVFDAGDYERPIGFNLLADTNTSIERSLVTSGIIASFKKLFGDSWGPRMEHILRNSLLTLLETPGTTLIGLERLLVDAAYRRKLLRRVSDPSVKAFWEREFLQWNDRYRNEAVGPVLNKIGHFLSNPILRAIIGQSKSQLKLRSLMDEGRILIVNLSKGKMGDDASNLLGSLIVTGLQIAAMSRAELPDDERRPFFAFIDEYQNFATPAFISILSEARKYGLGLTIAHQYLDQVDQEIRNAVFGNAGSFLSFQVGSRDAQILAEQFVERIADGSLVVASPSILPLLFSTDPLTFFVE